MVEASVTITVTPVNDAPQFGSAPPVQVNAASPVPLTEGAGTFSLEAEQAVDAEDEHITYRWEVSPGSDFSQPILTVSGTLENGRVHIDTTRTATLDALVPFGLVPGSSVQFHHRLVAIDASGGRTAGPTQSILIERASATAADRSTEIPTDVYLDQNYPNPFNPSSTIRFGLPEPGLTVIQLYDIQGRQVRKLFDRRLPAGHHSVQVNLGRLPSGTYVYRLKTGQTTRSQILQLVK